MKTAEEIVISHLKDGFLLGSNPAHVPIHNVVILMKEYAIQVTNQALNDAAEKIKLGDTVTAIQKSILLTEIKLP